MDNQNKKCSSIKHSENKAISYCQECKIFLCNKCHNLHSELFENHKSYSLDKNINDIYTDICKEDKHKQNLEFYLQKS